MSKQTAEPPRVRTLLPVLVFVGMVVAVVSSLGAPLVPTIAAVERVSLSSAQWSLTITLLAGALATPTMGRLGDGPRRRTVILAGLAAVVTGSVLAALPISFSVLLVGRALQGVGLGLTPLAIATARDALPPEQAKPGVALLSITTVAGVGLGYPLTGVISQTLGIHAAFWFGASVSALALVLAAVVVPSSETLPSVPLDATGAALLGAALAALLLALSEGGHWGWTSGRLLALLTCAVVLLPAWVAHELRAAHPLVELRLVRRRSVLTADVTALLAGVGMYLLMSLVTRFVQTPRSVTGYGFSSSVAVAGLILLPFSLASVAASRVAAFLARRSSPERVLPMGCGLFLAAMLAFVVARGSYWQVTGTMVLAGLAVGCTFAVMPALIVRAVPAQETGSAMSFNQVLRYVGYSVGSALSATVLQAHTPRGHVLPSASGYGAAGLLGCGVWALALALSLGLPGPRALVLEQDEADAGGDGHGSVPGLVGTR